MIKFKGNMRNEAGYEGRGPEGRGGGGGAKRRWQNCLINLFGFSFDIYIMCMVGPGGGSCVRDGALVCERESQRN